MSDLEDLKKFILKKKEHYIKCIRHHRQYENHYAFYEGRLKMLREIFEFLNMEDS